MRFVRRTLLLAASTAVLIAASPALAQIAAPAEAQPTDPWVQATSDIPADANIRFGVLPNGMQYALMRNATPPGQASLRLRIDAGSLMETENQLGLAHFMEHMVFNGTTNIPENELLQTQARLGIAFGADSNAFTAFDQTVYMLDLPRTDAETVETSLKMLREQMSEALMAPDAIDAERGVIEGEERLRNTPEFRALKARFEFLARGQLLPRRFPIGELNVILNAPRDRFVEFYEAYYRPSRATLAAVGDFDVDQMEQRIRAAFADWRPKAPDGASPNLGTVAGRSSEARIVVESGAQPSVELNWVRAPQIDPDSRSERRQSLLESLPIAVLNRRLGLLARSDNPPFTQAKASSGVLLDSLQVSSVTASIEPGNWARALAAVEQEQRRLGTYGISQAELDREITALRTALEQRVAAAGTRLTPAIADSIIDAVNDREVVTDPATDLAMFNDAVASLRPEEINRSVGALFSGVGPLAFLVHPTEIQGGEGAVLAEVERSRQVEVTAPVAQTTSAWPYESFGTASEITERRDVAELGATIVSFANGVRLTIKQTNYRDEQIMIGVRAGIGERGLSPDRPSPLSPGAQLITAGGLGQLSADELSRALNGHVVSANIGLAGKDWVFSGVTRPADLELQFQVLAAFLTDPGLRPAPFARFKADYPQFLAQQMATPDAAFGLQAFQILNGGDVRAALPTEEAVAGWTNEQFRQELLAAWATGPIEIVVVGDVSVEAAVAAVGSTFGALPPRGADPEPAPRSDKRTFPSHTVQPVQLTHAGPADQALGYVVWPTTDQMSDRTEARRIRLLSEVMNLRILEEIREKQGLAYAPTIGATASSDYQGWGMLAISAETAPDKLDAFFAAVDSIADGLRRTPPTEDELNRARLPLLEGLRRSQATNEYWFGQLSEIAERPSDIEQALTTISDFEEVKPADIREVARRYLRSDTVWRARVTSRAANASSGR